jgi:Ni,Fe-hydrogenase III component G
VPWKEVEIGLRRHFPEAVDRWERPNDGRIRARVSAGTLFDVVRFLTDAGQARLITITAVDAGDGGLDLWYHFDFSQEPQVLSLCVRIENREPAVRSVTPIAATAEWIEREIAEGFGVAFLGHPQPRKLLSAAGAVRNRTPMRKP